MKVSVMLIVNCYYYPVSVIATAMLSSLDSKQCSRAVQD
jgi:hypothetical protein